MKNLLANWKTTSAGVAMIVGTDVHLVFAVIHHTADETLWTASLMANITGLGLIFAGDGSKSAQAHDETKALVADLQNQISQVKQDTSMVTKPLTTQPPGSTPVQQSTTTKP